MNLRPQTKSCEPKAPKIIRTKGESHSMFCECIWGEALRPPPQPPTSFFFLGLPPLQRRPTPTWNVSTSNWNHEKTNNSQNISAPFSQWRHCLEWLSVLDASTSLPWEPLRNDASVAFQSTVMCNRQKRRPSRQPLRLFANWSTREDSCVMPWWLGESQEFDQISTKYQPFEQGFHRETVTGTSWCSKLLVQETSLACWDSICLLAMIAMSQCRKVGLCISWVW